MTRILGVDGGITGGLAVIGLENGSAPRLLDAIDIPTIGEPGARLRVDILAVRAFILTHRPQHAIVENGQPMPRQGVSSTFRYGRAIGGIEAAIILSEIPLTLVTPVVWKRHHGLRGSNKEHSRQKALLLLPHGHSLLARKRDHGKAEACLLALYGGATLVIGGVR